MNRFLKIVTNCRFLIIAFLTMMFFSYATYAENINISLNYGINKVAKNGNELPIELTLENRDAQDFKGYVTLEVYENNNSVYIYRVDVDIEARSSKTYYRSISITNLSNTVMMYVYNKKEEQIVNERTNIDLSYYNDKLIIGILSSDYNSLSYIDNLIIPNTNIQTKIVPIDALKLSENRNYIANIDMFIISDYNVSSIAGFDDEVYSFLNDGKVIFIGIGKENGINTLPSIVKREIANNTLNKEIAQKYVYGKVVCTPYSFSDLAKEKDASNNFLSLFERNVEEQWLMKIINNYNASLNNDYYNIGNILNIIDKMKLPDIFIITVLLLFYVTILTIIIYVFLRNVNKREQYGRYALMFSIIYTVGMVGFGYSVMKKNTFLTYLSIVNINDANVKETAFLNFRTSENGNYSFNTDKKIKLNPILRNNKVPIVGLDFMDTKKIKTTTFTEDENRKIVSIENAKDFDSNIFVYENNNYLNDVYNLDTSFQRIDGNITGRITNKMNLTIKNAHVLLYGKVLRIGDIQPNHSISLSRATKIGIPIGNNPMTAEILSDENNRNIVKYYLDENVSEYYDYGLLFGFIDKNGTIDINSQDVGDVYGRTLIVTKINREQSMIVDDYCSLENEVNNVEGYYDHITNTINGDTEVVNEYSFGNAGIISKIYLEGIDNYDQGSLEANVPFYGDISAYNYRTNNYEIITNNVIDYGKISDYVMPNNRIIIKFTPLSRDPLYRKISIPVVRAIAEK